MIYERRFVILQKPCVPTHLWKIYRFVYAQLGYYLTDASDFDSHPYILWWFFGPEKGKVTFYNRKLTKV